MNSFKKCLKLMNTIFSIWNEIDRDMLVHSFSICRLYSFSMVTFLTSFFIILLDVYWSPFLSKRYHLDFLYLLCIVTFLVIAAWLEVVQNKKRKLLLFCITLLAFYVFVAEFLFFCISFDGNYVMCYPEKLNEIYNGLRFGL